MVFGAEIGSADVGEDGLADERAEGRGGGAGEQGEEGPEETGKMVRSGAKKRRGAHSMDVSTFLLRRMTRLWRRVLRVSGLSAP